MLSKVSLSLSFICLVLVGALTIGCGSSSSGPKPCTGGPYNAVGDWQITVSTTGGGSVTGYGAIDSAGLALFFDNALPASSGDTLQLPTLTGTCAFSGSINSFAEPGGPDSGTEVSDAITGNVISTTPASGSPATSITGSFTGSGSPSGTISAVPFTPLTGSVAAVTGTKTGAVQGSFNTTPILLATTFTAAGSNNSMSFATTNEAGCLASGTFTQVGTGNVFDVSITLMPTCPITGTFMGIGFESSTDYFSINGGGADTYLYADILDGTNTFVIEFF